VLKAVRNVDNSCSSQTPAVDTILRMSAPPDDDDLLAPGTRVRIRGLASAASADLNGRVGVVIRWVPSTERHTVALFACPV
jgi:hypothetical protein